MKITANILVLAGFLYLSSCSDLDRTEPERVLASWVDQEISSSALSSVANSSSSIQIMPSSSSFVVNSSSSVMVSSSSSLAISSSSSSSSVSSSSANTWCATAGNCGTFTDSRDGQEYKWTKIGNQIWMAENLAWLPSVNTESQYSTSTAYYYVYDYNGTNVATAKASNNFINNGVLYNWTAAINACPANWHLPSDAEWMALESFLSMSTTQQQSTGVRGTNQGTLLKATQGWANNSGQDSYSFSWKGVGNYYGNLGIDYFYGINLYSDMWTATSYSSDKAYLRYANYDKTGIARLPNSKLLGLAIRCIQNE